MKPAKKSVMSGESKKNVSEKKTMSSLFGTKTPLKGGEKDDMPKMSATKKKLMGKKIG